MPLTAKAAARPVHSLVRDARQLQERQQSMPKWRMPLVPQPVQQQIAEGAVTHQQPGLGLVAPLHMMRYDPRQNGRIQQQHTPFDPAESTG